MASVIIGDYEYTSLGNRTANVKVVDRSKTSYEAMLSTVTIDGTEHNVTDLSRCFHMCTNMTEVPTLSTNAVDMVSCFESCWKLNDNTISIPSSVQYMHDCFWGCESLLTMPTIPSGVTDISYCFCNCTGLVEASVLPSSIINMEGCFSNCRALVSAPTIRQNVDRMSYCFYNCVNLTGELLVENTPTYGLNLFGNTEKEIVIFRSNETQSATEWREVASEYENVYFEGEGAPDPKLVARTIEKGFLENDTWRYDANGTWIKYEMVPELSLATANEVKSFQVKIDNESITITKAWIVSDGVYTNYFEYNALDRITTQVQVTDRFNKASNIVSKTLAGNFVMLDFMPGGQGMSIGRVGTRDGLDIRIPTTIGEGLIPPQKNGGVDLGNYQLIIGKYNDTDSQYSDDLFVIGNGANDANRKNTFTIDQNGYMNVVNGFEIKVQNNALMTFKPGDISIGQLDGTQSYANIKYNSFQLFDIEAAELIYTATKFDDESTYQVGDIIKFVDFLTEEAKEYYRCKVAVTTPGPWDSTCWERIYPSPYFSISDLRDKNGKVDYSEKIVINKRGDGTNVVTVSYPILTLGNTYINGVEEGMAQWTSYNNDVTFPNRTLHEGDIVIIEYTIRRGTEGIELLKSYNLGYRNPSSSVGQLSLIDGFNNEASGKFSYAGGIECEASGAYSYARGQKAIARGQAAHAEGINTIASNYSSHAEGSRTTASEDNAHAEGASTTASGICSHAEGYSTTASGTHSHSEGNSTTASGSYSHSEGQETTASGDFGSHAEGYGTTASGSSSHSEGHVTTASGSSSHAEGHRTTASGADSHAEGASTTASGIYSHAEGYSTTASGDHSHTQNLNTVAGYEAQTAIGKYNDNQSDTAFEIGNGSLNGGRSNALTVDWNGNIVTKDLELTRGTIPASSNYRNKITFTDSNDTTLGYIRTPFLTDGREGIQIETTRTVDGTAIYNGIQMYINASGTPSINLNHPAAWRTALGLEPFTPSISITSTTGTLNSYVIRQMGKLVSLTLYVYNTSSVASAQNIYQGTINTEALRPIAYTTNATFIGARLFGGSINVAGNITLRNTTASAVTTSSSNMAISFVYFVK